MESLEQAGLKTWVYAQLQVIQITILISSIITVLSFTGAGEITPVTASPTLHSESQKHSIVIFGA